MRIKRTDVEKATALFGKEKWQEEVHLAKPPLVINNSLFKPILGVFEKSDSRDVYTQVLSELKWVVSILTVGILGPLLPPLYRIKKRCATCKHIWK